MSTNPKKVTAIKTLQKKLGMNDAAYRDALERLTGCRSCTDMAELQLNSVLEYLHGLERDMFGGSPAQMGLIRHLWDTMYRCGLVSNGSAGALDNYCRRMVRVPLERCTPAQCQRVIECLKQWWRRGANPAHVALLDTMLSGPESGRVVQ